MENMKKNLRAYRPFNYIKFMVFKGVFGYLLGTVFSLVFLFANVSSIVYIVTPNGILFLPSPSPGPEAVGFPRVSPKPWHLKG
jgi:hypothetical protein